MYPAMLANIMNSGDLSLLRGFFTEFSIKNCQYIDHFPGSSQINLSWNRSFEGVDAIMKYFQTFWTPDTQSLIPDFSVSIRWAAIKQYLYKEHSEVMCGISYQATKIFSLENVLSLLQNSSFSKKSSSSSVPPALMPDQVTQLFAALMVINIVNLISNPINIKYDGMVLFKLDDQSRICELQFGPETQRR
jgi:hypothetical protein